MSDVLTHETKQSSTKSNVILDVQDLKVHFPIDGGFLQREVGAVAAKLRRQRAAEHRCGPEHPWIQELEQAPQLAEVILYRRPAEGEAMRAAQHASRLRRRGRRVLDGLRLV